MQAKSWAKKRDFCAATEKKRHPNENNGGFIKIIRIYSEVYVRHNKISTFITVIQAFFSKNEQNLTDASYKEKMFVWIFVWIEYCWANGYIDR